MYNRLDLNNGRIFPRTADKTKDRSARRKGHNTGLGSRAARGAPSREEGLKLSLHWPPSSVPGGVDAALLPPTSHEGPLGATSVALSTPAPHPRKPNKLEPRAIRERGAMVLAPSDNAVVWGVGEECWSVPWKRFQLSWFTLWRQLSCRRLFLSSLYILLT